MCGELWFRGEQLLWLEELNPDYYVAVRTQPPGDDKCDDDQMIEPRMIRLKELPAFKIENADKNAWRYWEVFQDSERSIGIGRVPLYFDIDDGLIPPNLEGAYNLTVLCLDFLEQQCEWITSSDQLRVVFSGRKGFHIEVKPNTSVDAQEVRWELLDYLKPHYDGAQSVVNNFNGTVLDPLSHKWVRMTDTVHSWFSDDRRILHRRRAFQMHPEEFREMRLQLILARADMT